MTYLILRLDNQSFCYNKVKKNIFLFYVLPLYCFKKRKKSKLFWFLESEKYNIIN
jgi:hypothetical protein